MLVFNGVDIAMLETFSESMVKETKENVKWYVVMVNQGRNNLQAPWLGITSFLTLGLMLGLLVFVGEAIRDSLDPRKTFN